MAKQEEFLIDIHPENSKAIIACARRYKKAQSIRLDSLAEEKKEKVKLLELIREADVKPLEDGKIKFRLDGLRISVTPRDELVQIREDGDEEGGGE